MHRATGDVDAVADEVVHVAASSGAQVLVDAGVATRDPAGHEERVYIDGARLEVIDTEPLPDDVSDIEALPRLFVLAHRWALESAGPMRVRVAGTDVETELPIAMPAALVATKLHAYCDRQLDDKRASDVYDIYRILETRDAGGEVADAINDGPSGLAEVVGELMRERLVDDAVRANRYLQAYGDPAWGDISSEDLRSVAGSLTDRLRR